MNCLSNKITLNRRGMLYTGMGLVGSMALTSIGMPPLGGLLVRTLTSSETMVSSTQSVGELIRFRDIWDISLKKIFDIIKKLCTKKYKKKYNKSQQN